MKNTSKKLISMLLVFTMVLSIAPAISLAANAAEMEKPQGISIIEDFDEYAKVERDEEGNVIANWATQVRAALPATVKVDGVDTPVEWASAAEYVDPSVVGYYALPGTVNGVENAVSITIQVREKINLVPYGYMEDTDTSTLKNCWNFNGGSNISLVTDPVKEGNYALMQNISKDSSNAQIIHNNKNTSKADLAAAFVASGAGTYYYGAWLKFGENGGKANAAFGIQFYKEDGSKFAKFKYHAPYLSEDAYDRTWGIAEVTKDGVLRVAVAAANMREDHVIALYNAAGERVSPEYIYSIEGSVTKLINNGTYGPLVIAILRYGDSVRALLG